MGMSSKHFISVETPARDESGELRCQGAFARGRHPTDIALAASTGRRRNIRDQIPRDSTACLRAEGYAPSSGEDDMAKGNFKSP